MTDKELLQQALDALKMSYELQDNGLINFEEYKLISDADILIRLNITIEAIKARLAQPEPEPVAWWHDRGDVVDLNVSGNGIPLYTAPSKKEWVGLTDDDVNYSVDAIYKGFDVKPRNEIEIEYFERVIKFVEAKLKEKNDR